MTAMEKQDIDSLKEEVAQLATRLDNIEGYFQNFDTTLSNHMTDYKKEQDKIREKVNELAVKVAGILGSEGLARFIIKWVIVPLIGLLAGLIGVKTIWPGIL